MKLKLYSFIFLLAATLCIQDLSAQQFVIADKDVTRPDQQFPDMDPSFTSFAALRGRGYNEISWAAASEQDTRRFIVEFSTNGVDFRTAGDEVTSSPDGTYGIMHYTNEQQPLMYRIRSEKMDGRMLYSKSFLVDGTPVSPVKVYPTTVTGNVVNVNADFPVRRINIFALDGNQVFAKDVNGQRDFIPVAIPSLGKGMYMMSFIGDGWQKTEKIVVP